ncbi:hypothetical protein K431DRAFT_281371 [Polychaeton citri CBS 116435]|uniref:Mediator of RNA polymerase II transcription subunit 17 n=1 Tax=Polychaeton citri CBS 116435 TaxID=1314669 RepID=A0A9P4QES0_9PEZI|nr:hypothetical protein K431DRAFT_281371 [Polychaeton citri CBS 116435]
MSATSSLSFQPWGQGKSEELSLQDVLARVALERGAFRDVSEASLQEEAAAEGALELSESSTSSDDEEEDPEQDDGKPKTRAELYAAKGEMLQSIHTAENDILMALDLVSFLETKDNAVAGQTTMSPALKSNGIPPGSLGIDLWQRLPVDQALEAQNEAVAFNTHMESLSQSVDNLLGAAKRLEDNVRRETQYWDQILSLSEQGWDICKLPGQGKRLGVRYGFSDSAAEFSGRGTAALNSDADGNIVVERGVWSKPKILRVVLKRGGVVVGTTKRLLSVDSAETSLDTRMRRARDSLFDEELYHEMLRESRVMISFGVRTTGSSIKLSTDTNDPGRASQLSFELVPLDDPLISSVPERDQDSFSQACLVLARLLLSQGHRDRMRKRTNVPQPLTDRKDDRPALPILRPILTFLLHRSALLGIEGYLSDADKLFGSACVDISGQRATLGVANLADAAGLGGLTRMFLQPWISEAIVTIAAPDSESSSIKIRLETFVGRNAFGTTYTVAKEGQKPYKVNTLDEMSEACDGCLASTLAVAIHERAGKDWNVSEKEALLTKNDKWDTQYVWLRFDSKSNTLSLTCDTRQTIWTGDVEKPGANQSLWKSAIEFLG